LTVCCLTGGVRLYFRPDQAGGAEEMVPLPAGTAAIVPRGHWHRLEPDAPTLMLITLRRGTRLERDQAGSGRPMGDLTGDLFHLRSVRLPGFWCCYLAVGPAGPAELPDPDQPDAGVRGQTRLAPSIGRGPSGTKAAPG
jgi:hypothetical protein